MPSTRICSCVAAVALIGSAAIACAQSQTTVLNLTDDCSAYSSVPLPQESEQAKAPSESPSCASYRSYRGIGRPVDYARARACAWRERLAQQKELGQNQAEPTAWVVGGSLILANMYVNGTGVKKNIPLAMRLACESEPAMLRLALPDLKNFETSPHAKGPFEFCRYAMTTFTMGFCSDYMSQIEADRRTRFYASSKSKMNPPQQIAFEKLLTASEAYFDAHGSEVDQGGTIRAIRTIGSEDILRNLFHTEFVHFERKKWPALTEKRIAAADSLMTREYAFKRQQLRNKAKEEIDEGVVTTDGLAKAQASWERYREAWVSFARLRYPSEAAAIRAQITLDRYRLLKAID